MNVMNLIHGICISKNHINNSHKWRFIYKYKENKILNERIKEFLGLNIFDASNNFITFMLSLDDNYTKYVSSIHFSQIYLSINLSDRLFVEYYPKSNRFEINEDNITYTVYRNTKYSNFIKNKWIPTTEKIKEEYIKIIINMAEYINIG